MGEVAVQVLKMFARAGIIVSIILTLLALFLLGYNGMQTLLNVGALADLISLLQIWLPFDINVVFGWLVTATTLYFAFKLAAISYNLINRFVS